VRARRGLGCVYTRLENALAQSVFINDNEAFVVVFWKRETRVAATRHYPEGKGSYEINRLVTAPSLGPRLSRASARHA